jgi:hypothetical protein
MNFLKTAKKAVAAFLGSAVVAVPVGLETGAKWWAAIAPFVAALATYLAPKNADA